MKQKKIHTVRLSQKFTFFAFMLSLILFPLGISFQATGLLLTRIISGFRFAFYYYVIMNIINLPTYYSFVYSMADYTIVKYTPTIYLPLMLHYLQPLTLILISWNFIWQLFVFNTLTMFFYNHFPSKKFKAIKTALEISRKRYI